MKAFRQYSIFLLMLFMLSVALLPGTAQQASVAQGSVVVPRLINFSGRLTDAQGKPITGMAGVTFAIYKDQNDGAPAWMETQNVTADTKGNYTVQLGATRSAGLPMELFTSGEARWLGVRVNGGDEQARVLLLSVPYVLKAADAETVGGLPASAFLLAGSANGVAAQTGIGASSSTAATPPPAGSISVTTAGGTANKLAKFDATSDIANSQIFDNGSNVGIGNTAPAAKLDVSGGGIFRGLLSLPAAGTATTTVGKNSQPFSFTASSYSSSAGSAVNQNFRWQAEPAGNNTANPSGTLNLLHSVGSNTPAETGLKIASNGQITFASGQKFPGTGTVSSIGLSAPASDFTVSGSPVSSSGTLALKWTTAPTSADTANAIVKRDSTGSFSAGGLNVAYVNANNSGGLAIIANASGDAAILGGSDTNSGVEGTTVSGYGVTGVAADPNGVGVYATNSAVDSIALQAVDTTESSAALVGDAPYALIANGSALAGEFIGNVEVEGSLSKDSGSFKIDHPLDPANKYLYHSFVESPDMMNIYNGNVTTDASGKAVVTLPEWFETLNRDFRYQLTVMGQFAQAIVSSKVANHQFSIQTDKPQVEVSWQVTGIRQDAWANAHRIPVEEVKPPQERGFYKHPELYNAPPEKSVVWARHPRVMKQWKQASSAAAQQANLEKH